MSQPQHTYTLRKELGFGVEIALSQLGEPHQIQIENFKGQTLAVRITDDPLASLRAQSLWTSMAITPGVLTTVPAGTRKLAVEVTVVGSLDQNSPTVFHVPGFFRGAESARYYGVDQSTVPGNSGVLPVIPLIHWNFRERSSLWRDAARSVPVLSDGDEIKGVTDLGSSGTHLVPIVANGPRFTEAGINGLPTADFDQANSEGFTTESQIDIDTDFSYLIIAEWDGVGASGVGAAIVHDVNNSYMFVQGGTAPSVAIQTLDDYASQSVAANGVFAAYASLVGTLGSASIHPTAGEATYTYTPVALALSDISVGSATGGASYWHGFISEIVIFDSSGVLPSNLALRDYVTQEYGLVWA